VSSPLIATTPVVSPLVVDASVYNDVPSRTLVVRLSENAGGFEKRLWREAHGALTRAEQSGWRNGGTLWASAPGAFQVAHAAPGDYGQLLFHFPVGSLGSSAYQSLVSKPGLYAVVGMDRSTSRFINVRFKHRL
jgi:hypothetical protein